MKQFLLLVACLCAGFTATHAQTVYVDAGATGLNDGSTWANAFTDLTVALDSAATGDAIWIAQGRYVTPDSSSFVIDRELSLYGGFAGGETSLDEADPAANETILSGDVSGNDGIGTYDSLLAVDNNRVLLIQDTAETSQYTVTIDGFTIRDGAIADDFQEGSLLPFAGGGIYSTAKLAVSRVRFTANRANFGAAVCVIFTTTTGTTFDDIASEGNYTDANNDFYLRLTSDMSITNSAFTGSTADTLPTGAIYLQDAFDVTIQDCSFDSIATQGPAAAIDAFNVLGVTVTGSTFTDLSSGSGGAIDIFNGSNNFDALRAVDVTEFIADSCAFTRMTTTGRGGAISLGNISHTISNSTFTNCEAGVGGGLYVVSTSADTAVYQSDIINSQFEGNVGSIVGGGICYLTDEVDVNILGSTFDQNTDAGQFGGGGIYLQGTSESGRSATLTNSVFTANTSPGGLGVGARIRGVNATVRDCRFENNIGDSGALEFDGEDVDYRVVNSIFTDNGAGTGNAFNRGAAIATFGFGRVLTGDLTIDSCTFTGNAAQNEVGRYSGGGAIYIEGISDTVSTVQISNSTFTNNASQGEGDGGAILIVENVDLQVENCDFIANNAGQFGGAISTARTLVRDTANALVVPFQYVPETEPQTTINRSLFISNSATVQGGAINLISSSITAKNSIFIGNALNIENGGSGGAIIINGSDVLYAKLDNYLINNTFYNNTDGGRVGTSTPDTVILGSSGNAVALFQSGLVGSDTNSVTLTIQNNAFFQSEDDEESLGLEQTDDDGLITVNSLGGNYFDNNLLAQLPITAVSGTDIVDVEAEVEDIFNDPFGDFADFPEVDLINEDTNPLVDGGTTGPLVPELDFFRETRDSMPDIGAIEFRDMRVDVAEPIENSGIQINFYPNPTANLLNIVSGNPAIQKYTVLLSDVQGRYLLGQQVSSGKGVLNLMDLPTGIYNLTLMIDGNTYSKQIFKK